MKEMRGNLSRAGPHLLPSSQLPWWRLRRSAVSGLRRAPVLRNTQYGEKVTICHKGKNTIKISTRAWPAHQASRRHGWDVRGGKEEGATPRSCTPRSCTPRRSTPRPLHGKKAEQSTTPVAATTSEPTAGKGKGNGKSGKSADKGENKDKHPD